jgi:tetratricopeptide (TPR) repeat protein
MFKRIAALALLVLLTCICPCALAQGWQTLYDAGSKACDEGHYQEALPSLTKALSLAEPAGGEHLADTLNALADCHYALDHYAQAEALHRRALQITAKLSGTASYDYAGLLNALGLDLFKQDKNEESVKVLKEALLIYEKDRTGNSDELLDIYNTLGRAYTDLNRRNESISCLKKAIAIATKKDPKGADLAENFECLAEAYSKYDQDEKAVSLLTRALALRGTAASPELAGCLLALGTAQDFTGRSEEAEKTLRRCLSVYEAVEGKESSGVASAQDALASVLRDAGNYKAAESLLKSSLAMRKKVLGAQHQMVSASAMKLGLLYKSLGNYAAAQPLMTEALAIDEKEFGPESKDVADDLSELGQCLLDAGKYQNAAPVFQRALAVYPKVAAADDDNFVDCLEAQAKLYRCTKRVADAEALERRCDSITNSMDRAQVKEFLSRPITNKWAVCIGISDFQDSSSNLDWPAKDASDIAGYLIKSAHFPAGNVRVLQNEQATRDNILNVIGGNWLPTRAGEDDLVVLFMSSHGSEASAEDGGYNFLICHDTDDEDWAGTAIPMQELMRMIKRRISANRVIIVLDACHSGASATGGKRTMVRGNFDARSLAHEAGQVIVCSSKPNELSTDSGEFQNGVFTHYLLEGLALRKDETTLGEAFSYMQKKVIEYSDDDDDPQTPVMKGLWNANNIKLAAPIAAMLKTEESADESDEEDNWQVIDKPGG